MSVDIARFTARQRAIEPYLAHLRQARLDTDVRQMKGSDEWVDNVKVWVEDIAYIAGKSPKHKPLRYTEVDEQLTDVLLVETVAALVTGAHYPKARSTIMEHSKTWEEFIEYVETKLAGLAQKVSGTN